MVNLESTQTNNGRFYRSPVTKLWYPSVTTVMGHEKADFFSQWRENEQNKAAMEFASKRGNAIHLLIENYLKDGTLPGKSNIYYYNLFMQMYPYLQKIQNIKMQESPLFSDTLRVAGRVDCVADYEGKLSIIDFKTSGKFKQESWITNYFNQATCYAIMFSELFRVKVTQIVILITSDDGSSQEFVKKSVDYAESTVDTIRKYYKKMSLDFIQESVK